MKNFTFRKRLLALALCAFAWIGANAVDVSGNTVTVYDTDVSDGDGLKYNAENNTLNGVNVAGVTILKLSGNFSGWDGNAFVNGGAWKANITEIDLSAANFSATTAETSTTTTELGPIDVVTVTNSWKFKDFTGVNTITWPDDGSLTVFPEECFMNCGIENLELPTTVKYICKQAFANCTSMHKVVFPEGIEDLLIVEEAFVQSSNITDVYVLTEDPITAQFHAFDYMTTNAQTNANGTMAALHFPESQTANYANLNHELDPVTAYNPGLFQKWLTAHRTAARSSAQGAGNGWHEFVTAGSMPPPDEVVVTGDVILMTYSNLEYDHLTPKGFKAYIVTGINPTSKVLQLQSIPVIPARTGVILYGQSNAKTINGDPTFAMTTVNYTGEALTRENYVENGPSPMNCLVPTCYGSYKVPGENNTEITIEVPQLTKGPYDTDNDEHPTKVTFRNFSFAKFSRTKTGNGTSDADDYRGFFRLMKNTAMPDGKAFLSFTVDEYTDATGGECVVVKDPYYTQVYSNDENPVLINEHVDGKDDYWTKAIWDHLVSTNNWGKRGSRATFAKFMGEPAFDDAVIDENEDGTATLILPNGFIESETDSEYYTLQGVKVSHPTKGVYIKDGKKVVIK